MSNFADLGSTSGCSTSHRLRAVFVLWTRTDPWSNRPLTKGISEMVWVVCHPHLSIGSGIRCCSCGNWPTIVQVAIDKRNGYKARMSSPPGQNNNWSLIQQPLISGGWYTQEVNVVWWIWDQSITASVPYGLTKWEETDPERLWADN